MAPVKNAFLLAFLFPIFAHAHEHGEQWTLANEAPAASLSGESDEFFARQVADLSRGHVSIVTMPDARMGYRAGEQLAAVEQGRLVMADTPAVALAEAEPVFNQASLAAGAGARARYRKARRSYEAAFERHGQKLLYATPEAQEDRGRLALSFTTVGLGRWNALDERERASVLEAARRTQERAWSALERVAAGR